MTASAALGWLAQAAELQPLHDRQRLVAIAIAIGVLLFVLELVRRRKLREEYSWVWVSTAILLIVLAVDGDLLVTLSRWIGSASPVSTLFFGALVFLLALVLQFSVRLSRLTHRHRTLAQRLALLEQEVTELRSANHKKSDAERAVEAGPRRAPEQGRDVVA